MRILVVDDSAFMRKALTTILSSEPGFEVVDTARDGEDALQKIVALKPDLVTLDIEMPRLDGLGVLERLRATLTPSYKPAVVVCSTLTSAGSHAALQAMRLGAMDFICKDPQALGTQAPEARTELITKLKAIGRARPSVLPTPSVSPPRPPSVRPQVKTRPDLVVIGSSTGGPPVLEVILTALPAAFAAPIVVAQHMPAIFTKSLAERLDNISAITLRHADKDIPDLVPGHAYIIQGGKHGRVHRSPAGRYSLEVSDQPAEALYKPSVDELLLSAASAARSRGLGVVLTGMGSDGALGARAMHAAGATVWAQSADTCAVYGMPRAVAESNAASAVMPPADIAAALCGLWLRPAIPA